MSKSSSAEWISVREAAEATDRKESTIRGWHRKGRVRSKREGRSLKLHRGDVERCMAAADSMAQGAKPGRRKEPRVADEETMTLAEFARRAGVNQRTARLWRQRGEIDLYTEANLARVQARHDAVAVDDINPETASDADLRNASQAELKRVKMYHEARMAKIKADREEGLVYDAEQVEATMRRLAHLAQASWQQAALILPAHLAGKDAAEMRSYLARHAQQQIEALANVFQSAGNQSRESE